MSLNGMRLQRGSTESMEPQVSLELVMCKVTLGDTREVSASTWSFLSNPFRCSCPQYGMRCIWQAEQPVQHVHGMAGEVVACRVVLNAARHHCTVI